MYVRYILYGMGLRPIVHMSPRILVHVIQHGTCSILPFQHLHSLPCVNLPVQEMNTTETTVISEDLQACPTGFCYLKAWLA